MEKSMAPGDEQLLNYLDGTLNDLQVNEVERQIENSSQVKMRLEELRLVHSMLRASGNLQLPSDNFTQRVMRNLDSFNAQSYSTRNGLLLLIGILAAIGVTLFMLQSGIFDSSSGAISLESLSFKKEWIRNTIPSIPYNGKIVVNFILIITTGLSFVLLDRILRPWFEQRSRMQRG